MKEKLKLLLILMLCPQLTWAATCALGSVKATTGSLTLAVDPRIAVGEQLGVRVSKGFSNATLVVGCSGGTSPYRSATTLTPSTTVEGAYETGIAGVGVFISDLYRTGQYIPVTASLSAVSVTPWVSKDEIRMTFVKTGPITPGNTGNNVYVNYYLNSNIFASLTVSSLTVIQKSCLANVNSQNQDVHLGSPKRSEFNGVGSVATSSERNFTIFLQCEADNIPVQVTFDPVTTSSGDGMLSINDDIDSATGVAVEILDANRVPLSFATAKTYHNASEKTIEIPLYARYRQTGTLTPGTANAAMTFTITQN